MLCLGQPLNGEHHDLYLIEETLEEILSLLKEADIEHQGLILNLDSSFDSKKFRNILEKKEIMEILKRTLEMETQKIINTLTMNFIREDFK